MGIDADPYEGAKTPTTWRATRPRMADSEYECAWVEGSVWMVRGGWSAGHHALPPEETQGMASGKGWRCRFCPPAGF